MMTTNKEFYYDDLVIYSEDCLKKCSVGLVTKEKPFIPTFLKKLNPNDVINPEEKLEKNKREIDVSLLDSPYESDDDSSSDGNLYDPPQKETVNVNWFIHKYISEINDVYDNTYIESIAGSNLHLYDRNLEMSDIVKLNLDGKVKVGTVFNVTMKADVLILGQNKIIKNVDCSRMKWIEPYMGKNLETNFTYNSWLGEVLETTLEVVVRFSDGARLKVPDSLLNQFDSKISSIWNSEFILEGCVMEGDAQELKSRKTKFISETVRHNSKWLNKLRQEQIVQVLVEKIIPVSADLQWVFGYNNKNGMVAESPAQTLRGKELEKLEPVHPYPWHCVTVGDVWYYELAENENILELEPEESVENVVYKLINGEFNNYSQYNGNDCVNPEDELSIQSQLCESQIPSGFVVKPRKKVLCNMKHRNKWKVSTRSYVTSSSDNSSDSESNEPEYHRESKHKIHEKDLQNHKIDSDILAKVALNRIKPNNFVAVGILLRKSTVDVNWQDGTVNYNIPSTKLIPQLYNIDEHEFFPGDFVVQKFDPLNPNPDQVKHNFGTIISANSKDRVAKIQWFDYVSSEDTGTSVIRSPQLEEIGVYDICALNEHHFVLGQEVIIKQEVAHNNYPAGFVTRLDPNNGMLVIRWPDGKEISMSPTDLLLTVESAVGGGSVSSEESGLDLSDDLSSELNSDTDSTDWETTEEFETNQADDAHLSKLICARKDLYELLDKIKKVETILNSVTEFTQILQANLPLHMSQMLSIRDIFHREERTENTNDVDLEISFSEQQTAIKTLFDIRHNISAIYKQCNDVGIKRMFECYRPKEFLSFRNIKNLIISNVNLKDCPQFENSQTNIEKVRLAGEKLLATNTDENLNTTEITNGSLVESNENSKSVVGNYLVTQYNNIRAHLRYLQESIEVWLQEKSCYQETDQLVELPMGTPTENAFQDGPKEQLAVESMPIDAGVELSLLQSPDCDDIFPANPILLEEVPTEKSLEDLKPELSDRTMSICEPIPDEHRGLFIMVESAPNTHKFLKAARPSLSNPKFSKAWKRDINLLTTSLPLGVIVKSFDDRIDLFSVMIVGPSGTPYQHALFFFDIQLGAQYPTEPPSVSYISLASERVNPNLYVEGRVCLSLLGTWNGKGTENWDSKVSSLLQLIVSLQGLILVSEPYYNEAGFEIRKGSEEGKENSQRYNENAINNISQSMVNLLHKPIPVFEMEIHDHFEQYGHSLVEIHNFWSSLSEEMLKSNQNLLLPDFPLAPVSKGFHLSIQRSINSLKQILYDKFKK